MTWSPSNSSGSASDGDEKTFYGPPTPIPSDYIFVAILVVMFLVGSPVNLVAFAHLHQNNGKRGMLAAYCAKSPLHLLKIHLNLTDLMVLFVYTTCKICWMITYQWRGGEFLCKLMQFANSTSFQISSNIIICIAVDRVLVVLYKRRTPEVCRAVQHSVALAWISALLTNVPQLFIWTVVTPFPTVHPSWQQCVTKSFSDRLEMRKIKSERTNSTDETRSLITALEQAYNLFHLVVIFWLPLTVIAMCYLFVAYQLNRLSVKHEPYKSYSNGSTAVHENYHFQLHDNFNRQKASQKRAFGITSASDYCTVSQTQNTEGDAVDRRFSAATDTSSTAALIVSKELRSAKKKTIKTNLLLVIAYVLCWLPYNILSFWHLVDPVGFKPFENSVRFVYHLIVLNSVINPFLYSMITFRVKLGSISRSV